MLSAVGGAEKAPATPHRSPKTLQAPARGLPPATHSVALTRLTGQSPAIEHVRGLIEKVSRSMAPVLLWGESGTGKELVARAIHDVSARNKGPFIAVNCGAIPEHLLEAEFFGYRKGPSPVQRKTARLFSKRLKGHLVSRRNRRPALVNAIRCCAPSKSVRSAPWVPPPKSLSMSASSAPPTKTRPQPCKTHLPARLVLPTQRDPDCAAAIAERLSDLPDLSRRLLEKIANESPACKLPELNHAALHALSHPFPGNVRELENLLQRAVALSNQQLIEPDDLGLSAAGCMPPPDNRPPPPGISPRHQKQRPAPPNSPQIWLATSTPSNETFWFRALEKHRLNRTAAGSSLGLTLRQMRYRMARLGIQITDQGLKLGERFDPEQDAD